jgi:hypothetical protein
MRAETVVVYYPVLFLDYLRKPTENSNQDILSPGRYIKADSPDNEIGVLIIRKRRSTQFYFILKE